MKKVKVFRCYNCKKLEDSLFIGPDNKKYCTFCFDDLFFYCDICNILQHQDDKLDHSDFADNNQLFMVCKECVEKQNEPV